MSQLFHCKNLIQLSLSLQSPQLISRYSHSSSTNLYSKLNKYLRSENKALSATHIHHSINMNLLQFILLALISKAKANFPPFAEILAGLSTVFHSPNPNAFHSIKISRSHHFCYKTPSAVRRPKRSTTALQYSKKKAITKRKRNF